MRGKIMLDSNVYSSVSYSNLISDNIKVLLVKDLLRQDMATEIWQTTHSELSVKPSYDNEWISEELDLDDDEITVTVTSKKGKIIEFTKKLEIYTPTSDDLIEWDKTHSEEFVSRMRHPPIDEVGGNTGVLR